MKKKQHGWQTTSSEMVHTNPWFSVQRDGTILPNGTEGEYFFVKTNGASFIVPVKGGKIIFIKQYRYIFDAAFLELPGGGIGSGETPQETAVKELREEVGYSAGAMEEVGKFIVFHGIADEQTHVFVAHDLTWVGQELETGEMGAEVVAIDIEKVYQMIEIGEIRDGQTISALMLAKRSIMRSDEKDGKI